MLELVDKEDYEDGQVIFEEGNSVDRIYVVLSGSVEIAKKANNKKHIIEVLEEGKVFGGISFLGMKEMQTTATAKGKTEVGIVERASLESEFNHLSLPLRSILKATFNSCNNVIGKASDFNSRSHPREQRVLALSYEDHNGFVKAYSGNISQGGLFIKTKSPLNTGEEFLLKLKLPGISDPLKIQCKVIWTRKREEDFKRPAGMGVKFCKIDPEHSMVLTQYLKTILGHAH
jgi:CRP/FNR family cyclic AMP-dependent transcriptional regulator